MRTQDKGSRAEDAAPELPAGPESAFHPLMAHLAGAETGHKHPKELGLKHSMAQDLGRVSEWELFPGAR